MLNVLVRNVNTFVIIVTINYNVEIYCMFTRFSLFDYFQVLIEIQMNSFLKVNVHEFQHL